MLTPQDNTIFCAKCAARLVQKGNFKQCPQCNMRYYFNAKPGAAALLYNSKGELLFVKRALEPEKGWWDLVGGFVDEHETFERAVRREAREEIGTDIASLQYIGSFAQEYFFDAQAVPVSVAMFTAVIVGEAVVISDESTDYMFVKPKDFDIETLAFAGQRAFVKEYLAKVG